MSGVGSLRLLRHPVALAVLVAVAFVAILAVRSKLFGLRSAPGDAFPKGFAGRLVEAGSGGEGAMRLLGERDDGTPVFSADIIRYKDAIEGVVEMPRPAVSLAEADRLGHDPAWRTPLAVSVYGMRGPVSAGFTETDARWVIELARRHELSESRAKAITLIAFAVTSRETAGANSYTDASLAEMVRVFESALTGSDEQPRRAALAMSDWPGWAELGGSYLDCLAVVAKGEHSEHSERASYVLRHTFGVETTP